MLNLTVRKISWYVVPLLALCLLIDLTKKPIEWLAMKGIKIDVEGK